MALHPHVARERVADGVVAHMAHVQLARRIGQHLEHVILGLAAVRRFGAVEIGLLGPALLPARLNFGRGIAGFARRRFRWGR